MLFTCVASHVLWCWDGLKVSRRQSQRGELIIITWQKVSQRSPTHINQASKTLNKMLKYIGNRYWFFISCFLVWLQQAFPSFLWTLIQRRKDIQHEVVIGQLVKSWVKAQLHIYILNKFQNNSQMSAKRHDIRHCLDGILNPFDWPIPNSFHLLMPLISIPEKSTSWSNSVKELIIHNALSIPLDTRIRCTLAFSMFNSGSFHFPQDLFNCTLL